MLIHWLWKLQCRFKFEFKKKATLKEISKNILNFSLVIIIIIIIIISKYLLVKNI